MANLAISNHTHSHSTKPSHSGVDFSLQSLFSHSSNRGFFAHGLFFLVVVDQETDFVPSILIVFSVNFVVFRGTLSLNVITILIKAFMDLLSFTHLLVLSPFKAMLHISHLMSCSVFYGFLFTCWDASRT